MRSCKIYTWLQAKDRIATLRSEGKADLAKDLANLVECMEATQVLARNSLMKKPWSELMNACKIVCEKNELELPLATKAMLTRRYIADRKGEDNWELAADAFMWSIALPQDEGGEESDTESMAFDWTKPSFGQFLPADDASDEDWEIWRKQLYLSFFDSSVFRLVESVKDKQPQLLTFSRAMLTSLQNDVDEAAPGTQELLYPLVHFCLFIIAVLDPRPGADGCSSADVWFCAQKPLAGAQKRRKKAGLSDINEASTFYNELKANEIWLALIKEYADYEAVEQQHGAEFSEFAADISSASREYTEHAVNAMKELKEKQVFAPPEEKALQAALKRLEKSIEWWRQNLRQDGTQELENVVATALKSNFEVLKLIDGTPTSSFKSLRTFANLLGEKKLDASIGASIASKQSQQAVVDIQEAVGKDLTDTNNRLALLELLRTGEHVAKTKETLTAMNKIFKGFPDICQALVNSRGAVNLSEVNKCFELIYQVIGDTHFIASGVLSQAAMKKQVDNLKKLVAALCDCKDKAASLLEAWNAHGDGCKEELFALHSSMVALQKVVDRPPKFDSGSEYEQGAAGVLACADAVLNGNTANPDAKGLYNTIEAFASGVVTNLMKGLERTRMILAVSAGGGSDVGTSWKADLADKANWSDVKARYSTSLKACAAAEIDKHLTALKTDRCFSWLASWPAS